ILKRYEVDRSRLSRDLTAAIDRLKSGNARTPALSPSLVKMLTEAWTLGSVNYGAARIRSAFTVLALRLDDELRRMVEESTRELDKIHPEELKKELQNIVAESGEDAGRAMAAAPSGDGRPLGGGGPGGPTPNLDQYTLNLTGRAARGDLDPVLGRDREIRQMVDVLTRRRQNNPILVGEAGVGKTAVVEGFAMRIHEGDVPPVLRNVTIRTLDLALLQAGAGVKGEFENRLKGLIEEVKSSPTPVILFIDEAHTMIGAGGAAGQGDAANLLKPALARGELRTIAATTWSEYKKYFEKDPALSRRFQLIKVEEPVEDQCLTMMRAVVPHLERHHGVRILDDGMDAAVRLSNRYIPDRQLPDKAVSVLDTACARLSLGQNSTPAAVEDAMRRVADYEVQQRVLERESAVGTDHSERLERIRSLMAAETERLAGLKERWETELDLVARIRAVRERLEASVGNGATPPATDEGEEAGTAEAAAGGAGSAEAAGGDATGGDGAGAEAGTGKEEGGPPGTGEAAGNGAGALEEALDPAFLEEIRAMDAAALRDRLGELNGELDALQEEEALVPVCVDAELVSQVISGWTGIPVGKMHRDDITTALSLEVRLGERIIGQDHALETISHRVRTSKAGIEDPGKPVGVFLLVGPSGVGKTETALSLSDLLYGGEDNLITINMSEFQESHTVSTLKGS
ncbi:MAG TPA: AAA family ATPase, partial [Longimicrobiales bacterium]|nr:AAA family ATPase [Longimicrobiales bacterium]